MINKSRRFTIIVSTMLQDAEKGTDRDERNVKTSEDGLFSGNYKNRGG